MLQASSTFRHDSWFENDVYEVLAEAGVALCHADVEDKEGADLQKTASWGYLRLRKEAYSDSELRDWTLEILAREWSSVFVFFKHEDEGIAPALAARFSAIFNAEQNRAS